MMAVYRYKAVDAAGRSHRGRVEALNGDDLELRLARMGLDLVNFRAPRLRRRHGCRRRVPRSDLISLCFHLEQVLRAGIPLLDGLSDLRATLDNRQLRDVTAVLIEEIEGGKNLSQAMQAFPRVFPAVFVHLVEAGEHSGELGQILSRLIDTLKWQDEQSARAKTLLLYPLLLVVVVTVVLLFLMLFVVPQLTAFLATMGQALPAHTVALLALSQFFLTYWQLLLCAPVLTVIGLALARCRWPRFATRIDGYLLRVPLLGALRKKFIVTRVCHTFALMYGAGISILDCMRSVERVAGNRAVARALRHAGLQMADGVGLSQSFAASALFPPLVIRMLRVGEQTGALDDALASVCYFYTRDVVDSVTRLQTLIPTLITLILGGFLLWIIAATLGPIYELFTQIDF